MATRLTLRLDFDTGHRLGPGKIALLEAIDRTGSIAAAGREFGMAYRRAWLLTDELNRTFGKPLIEARGGGRNGGGAALTALGREVVALYRAAEAKAEKSIAAEVRRMSRSLASL
ncbi:MAG TPA: LysR family transcriptional regulator [Bauldia sp.]|nr:LysR family transcriptional regulator [Bauldia sp.]